MGEMCGLTMCVAVAQGNAIGIPACAVASAGREAESPKCVRGNDAGLAANSPGRRHCQELFMDKLPQHFV